jgi:hypothetical protein
LDDRILWFENDGSQNFTKHSVVTSIEYPRSVFAMDIDMDGDIDIFAAFSPYVAWFENDGSQNFIRHDIDSDVVGALEVYPADIDSDGDIDLTSASFNQDKIAWYENDGNQNFTTHILSTTSDYAYSVYAADVDNDGDMDILSASREDNTIAWFENDGDENFTWHLISDQAVKAVSVMAMDMDGDGDTDVLSASALDSEINWYENLTLTQVSSVSAEIPSEFSLKQNYPNPFNPSTTITYSIPRESFVEIKVFNLEGSEVSVIANEEQPAGKYTAEFSAAALPSGVYFYRIRAGSFTQTRKMILMK